MGNLGHPEQGNAQNRFHFIRNDLPGVHFFPKEFIGEFQVKVFGGHRSQVLWMREKVPGSIEGYRDTLDSL